LGSLGTTLATTGNTTDAVASGVSSSVAVEENAVALAIPLARVAIPLTEASAPYVLAGLVTTGVLSQVDADALRAEVDRQLYTLGELTDEAATEIAQAFGVTVNVIKEVANQSNDETNNQESSQGGTTASGGAPEPDDEGEFTPAQTKSINKIKEIDHMLNSRNNLSGDMLDEGHIEKLLNAQKGPEREVSSLTNSLRNPNLSDSQRNTINSSINTARTMLRRINELTR